ncbi:2Fe-2S iron-sulfur cluster-binding protein [Pseudobacteroides cellulosolvens]|uniref:Ferredoxin n=1 Tax=Pseudobacteroides cellulosolvens ATCC 35603 = DSM 2933 TaxID=398512 RepID=A0A0L6JNB6_9FIRM|nr:2Fe-2S iron-sulfur cluster binding domain-containing protein [Pseudobacteroides cellulosolvens]KNY27301.1 ferredoxin [Pseudobacteroides cellulosolvens ATCC 35603 = DSM 2933]
MKVKFIKKTKIKKEKTILDVAGDLNLKIKASCDGKGKCGKCIVRVIGGDVSDLTKAEKKFLNDDEIEKGLRLACEAKITGDVKIEIID